MIPSYTPFESVLLPLPNAFVVQPDTESVLVETNGFFLHRWKLWMSRLVKEAGDDLLHEQNRY